MINAKRAREIMEQSCSDKEAREQAMIKNEAKKVCERIGQAAFHGNAAVEVSTRGYNRPLGVVSYLQKELGYAVKYDPQREVIAASW